MMYLTYDINERLNGCLPVKNESNLEYQGTFIKKMLKHYLCEIMQEFYHQESWEVYDKDLRELLIWFDALTSNKSINNNAITNFLLIVLSIVQDKQITWYNIYGDISEPFFVYNEDSKIIELHAHTEEDSLKVLLYVYDEFIRTFGLGVAYSRELIRSEDQK